MSHAMGRQSPRLTDLDDFTLLRCFGWLTPLPDLFNIAATCRRFRDLALDRRSWLYVTRAAAADGAPVTATAARPATAKAAGSTPQQQAQHGSAQRQRAATSTIPPGSAALAAVGDSGGPHWYRSRFATLADAVAASRPGDTILLEPGPEPHIIDAAVVVSHPLHILGGGGEAGDCLLAGARGIEALMDFRASGQLANLTLLATASACVAHTKGRLIVQGCTLECDAVGLPHLFAPLLTRAVSGALLPRTPAAAAAAGATHTLRADPRAAAAGGALAPALPAMHLAGFKRSAEDADSCAVEAAAGTAGSIVPPASKRMLAWRRAAEAAAGPGLLNVVETRIKARGSAVDLRGSGRLSSVRCIYSTGHALMWLEVDSANCGVASSAGISWGADAAHMAPPAAASDAEAGTAAGSSCGAQLSMPAAPLPATPLPSWLSRAAAVGFDPASFQRRAQQLAAASPATSQQVPAAGQAEVLHAAGVGSASSSSMERKAEEWCLMHHHQLAAHKLGLDTAATAAQKQE